MNWKWLDSMEDVLFTFVPLEIGADGLAFFFGLVFHGREGRDFVVGHGLIFGLLFLLLRTAASASSSSSSSAVGGGTVVVARVLLRRHRALTDDLVALASQTKNGSFVLGNSWLRHTNDINHEHWFHCREFAGLVNQTRLEQPDPRFQTLAMTSFSTEIQRLLANSQNSSLRFLVLIVILLNIAHVYICTDDK